MAVAQASQPNLEPASKVAETPWESAAIAQPEQRSTLSGGLRYLEYARYEEAFRLLSSAAAQTRSQTADFNSHVEAVCGIAACYAAFGQTGHAIDVLHGALARAKNDLLDVAFPSERGLSNLSACLAEHLLNGGQYAQAFALYEEALLWKTHISPRDPNGEAACRIGLGKIKLLEGDYDAANAHFVEVVAAHEIVNHQNLIGATLGQGIALVLLGYDDGFNYVSSAYHEEKCSFKSGGNACRSFMFRFVEERLTKDARYEELLGELRSVVE